MGDFGVKHLTGLAWLFGLIITLLIVTLVIRKKYHKGENYDRNVVKYAAIFIWIWEFIKTIYIFNSAAYGGVGDYTAYMLPFHICSMALYAYVIIGFSKGKLSNFIKPFAFATMLLVTSIILTIPDSSGILGGEANWSFIDANILPYQSFLYHGTLVFVPLYMVFSGFYNPKISDIWKATITLLVTATFAFTLNKVLGVTDFMMLEYGNGNPFQYLVSSNYLLYLAILAGVAIGGTAVILGLAQLLKKIFGKKAKA
ncbi:MAG: hypothetical protein AB7S44_00720 [Spirochaetales bacterium]